MEFTTRSQQDMKFPNHHVFSWFITFSLILCFLSCVFLGVASGLPWIGLASGAFGLINWWILPATYFNAYQGMTAALLILSYAFMHSAYRWPVLAGVLVTLNIMANQSVCIYAVALMAPFIFQKKRPACGLPEISWGSRRQLGGD